MPRIRNIKPEFFTSESVSELPLRARLTWIGLWTQCDNHGRTRDNVKLVKAALWPLDDVSLRDIEDDLSVLAKLGFIVRYEVANKRYLAVVNWDEHQYGAGKGNPKYPGPPDSPNESRPDLDESRTRPDESIPIQGSGVRGQGRGTRESANPPPPRTCPRHRNDPDPPNCRECKTHRLDYERWNQDREQRKVQLRAELKTARADPDLRCPHGTDGGLHLRSDTGQPLCASCRAEAREAS